MADRSHDQVMLPGCQADWAGADLPHQLFDCAECLGTGAFRRSQHVDGVFEQVLIGAADTGVFRAGHRVPAHKPGGVEAFESIHHLFLGAPHIRDDSIGWHRVPDQGGYLHDAGDRNGQEDDSCAGDAKVVVRRALVNGAGIQGYSQRLFILIYAYDAVFTQGLEAHAQRASDDTQANDGDLGLLHLFTPRRTHRPGAARSPWTGP